MLNKRKIINDPIHGFIRITHDIVYDVLEHSYFQRLRHIGQTGLLNLIFPGATHTRFHHALGAMHLMSKVLETLKMKGVMIFQEEEKAALLAILLHDIGHGPFSHALESVLMEDWHHENLSLLLMHRLNKEFGGELSMAIEMFQGKYPRKFFNQLVSSQLDVDRLDYLKRDSFFTGVAEGNVNTERLISMLNVYEDELVVDAKGVYSVEHFLTSRMFMYWQVYYHKTAAMAENLLVSILKSAKALALENKLETKSEALNYFLKSKKIIEPSSEDIRQFTRLDDNDIIEAIKTWSSHEDFLLSYQCQCIIHRNLPKTSIGTKPFSTEEIEMKKQQAIAFFGKQEAEELVYALERNLLPYNAVQQPIHIFTKNQEIIPLHQYEGHILTSSITQSSKRYVLVTPRELEKK